MSLADVAFLIGFWGIWITLAYWIFLSIGAFFYQQRTEQERRTLSDFTGPFPFVSILVPAHNEALVIERTVHALCNQSYPLDRFEVIIVNDGSTDETAVIVEQLQNQYAHLKLINIPEGKGGKGKSRTLNLGLKHARGELISVFDADNTPEPNMLFMLVATLQNDPRLVAVNGKVRTRNRNASWLTRFINLEFMYFQWLFQGGRWHWFRISMLMGTGYVIRRDILELLGGFDEKSLVDDTEMSLRIFRGRYTIRWIPFAITWEQEPEHFSVWFRQRTRWAMGNLTVIWKYLPLSFVHPYPLGLEVLTFVLNFILFVPALLASDLVLFLTLTGLSGVSYTGPFAVLWGLAVVIFMLHMGFSIRVEENRASNYFYAFLSYFTYAQLFIPVLFNAFFKLMIQTLLRQNIKWDKTARTQEDAH